MNKRFSFIAYYIPAIYQRALKIGAVTSSHQKRKWAQEETKILEKYMRYEPQTHREYCSEEKKDETLVKS